MTVRIAKYRMSGLGRSVMQHGVCASPVSELFDNHSPVTGLHPNSSSESPIIQD